MEKMPLDLQESNLFMRRKTSNQAQEGGGGGGSGGSSQLPQLHHHAAPPQPLPFPHTTTSQPLSQHHTISSQPLPRYPAISSHPQPRYPAISSHPQPRYPAISSHPRPPYPTISSHPQVQKPTASSQPVPQHITIASHQAPLHHTTSQPLPQPQQCTAFNPTPFHYTSPPLFPSHSLSRPKHLPLRNIASPFPLQPTISTPPESGYGVLLKSSQGSHSENHDVIQEFPPPPKCTPPPKPPRKLFGIQAQPDKSPQQNDFTKIKEDTGRLKREVKNKYLANLDFGQAVSEDPPDFPPPSPSDASLHSMSLDSMSCTRCGDGFEPQEKIVNSNGQLWHTQCFVCAQCFRPFPDDIFYEFEGRKYCEHDFQVLFAPCCNKCNEFIIGRVIKAMANNWHPQCFTCELCHKELADLGFIRNAGRALCHECNARIKAESQGKYMCHKCHATIDGQPLRWRGDTFHPYHFNCAACGVELTADAREVKSRAGYTANEMNELYCLRCHDKMGIPICGACRRPIEERVVTALGKHWHVEHFVCAKCEKPFMGNRHYERKGLAYCETHYHELFGNLCFICNTVIYGDVVTALNKAWCQHHFACATCDTKMTQKTKFFEFDQKPICKKCYEKFPQELKKRLKKQHDIQARGGKPLP